ncbi:hypothetical protein KIN20_023808 [Parelaphostrongylus tenuis]|uniref:F-box domain-containing protein n=1 Tax=Parelaphostrongylus tenuis TaxID=148309 RepID=A0AAD5MSK5_PARTN|nr:hypothetical protein KIN20_023808 [Parelaphostrongylus tenuis]
MRRPQVIPNLPDVVLLHIFSFLDYQLLCKAEMVCRRWQTLVIALMRREIHELAVEKYYESSPSVVHSKSFRSIIT